jgi:uncharacterized membrane protein
MTIEPALTLVLLASLFVGTHVGLATRRLRAALVARLGGGGFFALYTLVATVSFAAMIGYYAAHRFEGAPGPALGAVAAARWPLMALIVAGVMLTAAGLTVYPRLAVALFDQPIGEPRGIERITRHPFFCGVALFGVAHVLLATRLIGAVLAAELAVLAIVGARHQDAKILARRGRPYADYLAATSIVPFAAIVAGRQRLIWSELPYGSLATGVGVALALRAVHDVIFAYGGLWIVVGVVAGGALASWQSFRRKRRVARRDALARPAAA